MLNAQERKTTLSLASIYAFRMLGLFMILPVFSIYAHKLPHATPFLIGLALGIYGLTQAILQIPFGMISDRIGRKPIIIIGLIIFVIGSLIAGFSHGIYGIIVGRAIQGAGAIGSTLTAMVADLTLEENRLKAMAVIGMTIGLSFVLAMIVGPILNNWVGLSGIFYLTACLALVGILIILFIVPTPKQHKLHRDSEPVLSQFATILKNRELLRLDFGIFCLHAMLTALFIVIPVVLANVAGLDANHQWYLYLPILILSFIAMVPFIIIAEAKRQMKKVFVGAVLVLMITQLLLLPFHFHTWSIAIILFLFFTVFTLLEASLPSLVAKIAPVASKGTAMGVYSSSQFFGIFIGGVIGGWAYHAFHFSGVFVFTAILGILWLITAATMKSPRHVSSKIHHLKDINIDVKQLLGIEGVAEAFIDKDEKVAYLKVDKRIFKDNSIAHL